MLRFTASLMKATARSRRLLAAVVVAAALPIAAHASEVVTFDWVPITENPTTGYTTPSGTLTLTLSSWALGGPTTPPNYGPYYASGTATTADITAFSYTAGDGQTTSLSNVTTRSVTSTIWATSGFDLPASGAQAPSAPTAGYYLVSAFTISGTTNQGAHFMIGNAAGTAGAIYGDGIHASGIGNGTNTFNATTSSPVIPAVADGGYWELSSMTAVPLPAGLPLLLGGLGLVGLFVRRKSSLPAA